MTVSGVGLNSSIMIQSLVDMRNRLNELQVQLGTGKKAQDYAGLGLDRGLAVGLRAHLAGIQGFQDTIGQVGVRLNMAQTALGQMSATAQTVKSTVLLSPFQLAGDNQTNDQKTAKIHLDTLVSLLNTRAGDRYLFAGRGVDQPAVVGTDQLLDGDGTRAGLKQVIAERRLADLGASGLGRLVVSAPSATSVALTQDAASSPFGFKLAGISSTTGATLSGPSGSPAAMSIDFTANPAAGQTVRFTFALPDGSTQDLTLTATASTTPAANEFTIGGSPAATAANLQTALTASLGTLASTALAAASAMAAGEEFFNVDAANPPQRVAGPPFDTATALVGGTAGNTVTWYVGEAGSDPARGTAQARADQSVSLAYGMRANEQGLRTIVQNVAVFAAATFSATDPDAAGNYDALKTRVAAALAGPPNQQRVADIQAELAGVQKALNSAAERHQHSTAMLGDFMQQVEGISQEQVAAQILALQTSLQATLQTTALLLRTNLLNYI